MGQFRYVSPDEVAQRHRTRNVETLLRQPRQPEHRNVEQVLSLGDVRYVLFRTRTYRIPPVPYKLGERVLESHARLVQYGRDVATTGKKEPTDKFYRQLTIQARLLWSHMRPTGKMKRMLWRLRLMRNPFYAASEKEITELTNFFLLCRMTSSVQPILGKVEAN